MSRNQYESWQKKMYRMQMREKKKKRRQEVVTHAHKLGLRTLLREIGKMERKIQEEERRQASNFEFQD